MTDEAPTDPHTRRAWRIAGIGTLVVGTGFAVVAALSGGGGRVGLAFFLLGATLSCTLGTLYAVTTGARDAFRGDDVGRGRAVAAAVLGFLAILLPIMTVGLTAS
ncbi:MAG: hypothetical protein KY437_05880 [Actinobacteria bacterium]|nr:hypothetical protein [Actinomycetota bacterium]